MRTNLQPWQPVVTHYNDGKIENSHPIIARAPRSGNLTKGLATKGGQESTPGRFGRDLTLTMRISALADELEIKKRGSG